MKKFIKIMGIAALMTGMTTGAMAQEQTQEIEKPGFFKQAFRDMKESARMQREIDKANFKAQKMETKAFYPVQSCHACLLLEHGREVFAGHAKFVCIETDIALSLEVFSN